MLFVREEIHSKLLIQYKPDSSAENTITLSSLEILMLKLQTSLFLRFVGDTI